jgi:cold shock CspA family protein
MTDEIRCWVKWYKPELKYGFAYDDNEVTYFIHKSEFKEDFEFLMQGDVILGIPEQNEKGWFLTDIQQEV